MSANDFRRLSFAISRRIVGLGQRRATDGFARLAEAGAAIAMDEIRLALLDIAASGMSACGQDPQGLEAKPVSPTRQGDAQGEPS